MEYFFAMASDPDTHDIYVGGTTRSEYITWGNVKRKNVMYNGQPGLNNPDTGSPVGSSKALVVKLKSTLTQPSCLTTCNTAFPLQASDVKSGHCYIDRHCYADGTSSPYSGSECTRCNAAVNPIQWSSPDTSAACFIKSACVASGAHAQKKSGYSYIDDKCLHCDPLVNSSAYSPVAGCELPSIFRGGCYTNSGSEVTSLAAMMSENQTNHMTIALMQTRNRALMSEVDTLNRQKLVLQTELDSSSSIGDEIAIPLILVVSVMLVVTSVTLIILVCKEKRGYPVFAPVTGTPFSGNATTEGTAYGNPAECSASHRVA